MKKYLVFVTLLLTTVPGFASHTTHKASTSKSSPQARASKSNQFHVNRAQVSHNSKANAADRRHVPEAERAFPGAKLDPTNTARMGHFSSPKANTSSAATVSFVSGARTAWGGADDQETESVIGDFNGDGNMDVARLVNNGSGESAVTQVSVLLGNGDGTFMAAALTTTDSNSDDPIVVGDLKNDGTDDIIQVHPEGDDCDAAKRKAVRPRPMGLPDCEASIDVMISNGDGTFADPVNYAVAPANLVGGLLTDVDGDGNLDVLVFDQSSPANVIVLLGNGDGTFQAATTLGTLTTSAPNNMIFADFNGDGNIDFAGQTESGQLQVTLASGAGLYANAPVSLVTPDGNYGACNSETGDLTGDSKPEIVSFNCNANTVTAYVNNGDGSFATGIYYDNNSSQYQSIYDGAIADMNGDGKNDIVVINDDTGDVSVFLGHGDGTVDVEPLSYDVGGFAWNTPLIADFNGDGIMDVVESDDLYNLVYLQGYGDGTFRAGATNPLPNSFDQFPYTGSVAAGDFNGDGIPDVVVGQHHNDGATGVVVYLGKGDGTFYPGVSYGSSSADTAVVVADFNGDGKLDIAAIDQNNNAVQIFLGNGDGTFNIAGLYPSGPGEEPSPQELVVGDFNHDGNMDIAVANSNAGDVGVLLGNGDGTFAAAVGYPITGYAPEAIAAADLNGDGYLDLAVAAYTDDGPPQIGILLGKSDNSGTFNAVSFVAVNGFPDEIAFGALIPSGNVDMAVTEGQGATYQGQIEIFTGKGDGTFNAPVAYAASVFDPTTDNSYPGSIQMFDINGDGNLDLVYINSNYGTVAVATGNGDGTIAAPLEFASTEYTYGLALADVNGDGAMDLLTGENEAGGFNVYLNANGSGTSGNFTVGTTTPSATVAAGASATYTLNLAGLNGYMGTISFSCGELPTGATCSFSPATVVSTGNLPLTTTMTIATTAAATANLLRPARPGSPALLASFGGMALFGMLLVGTGKKGRQRRAAIALTLLLLATLGTVVGCSSNSTTATTTSTATPAGSYVVTVTSTGTGTGAPTHAVNVTMIVQ